MTRTGLRIRAAYLLLAAAFLLFLGLSLCVGSMPVGPREVTAVLLGRGEGAAAQVVLRLRHMEGMRMSEIALLTGSTETALRKALSRARKALLQKLRNNDNR